jgi:imidazolonepropionase-like amidohydrolase
MDTNRPLLAIVNGTLIDGSGRPPVANQALVIEGDRIRSVGALPAGIDLRDDTQVKVIDAAGRFVMPGLIDAHTHLSYGYPVIPGEGRGRGPTRPELSVLKAARSAQRVLRSGVTSICVPGGTWFIDVGVRDAIRFGLLEGPRVHCAGRMIITYGSIEDDEPSWVGTPDHGIGVLCNSASEMVTEVRRQTKHGVDFVKLADSRSGDIHWPARRSPPWSTRRIDATPAWPSTRAGRARRAPPPRPASTGSSTPTSPPRPTWSPSPRPAFRSFPP